MEANKLAYLFKWDKDSDWTLAYVGTDFKDMMAITPIWTPIKRIFIGTEVVYPDAVFPMWNLFQRKKKLWMILSV